MSDPQPLIRLFTAHSRALVLYARQWLDASAAEDAVQDVFARLVERGTLEPSVPLLFASVRNAAIDAARATSARRRRERAAAEDADAWFERRDDDLIDADAAGVALRNLPEPRREAVVLRLWAGPGFEQIAETLGCAVSTAFAHYRAGLTGIRARLEQSCRTKTS